MITGFANKFGYQPTLAQHIYNQKLALFKVLPNV